MEQMGWGSWSGIAFWQLLVHLWPQMQPIPQEEIQKSLFWVVIPQDWLFCLWNLAAEIFRITKIVQAAPVSQIPLEFGFRIFQFRGWWSKQVGAWDLALLFGSRWSVFNPRHVRFCKRNSKIPLSGSICCQKILAASKINKPLVHLIPSQVLLQNSPIQRMVEQAGRCLGSGIAFGQPLLCLWSKTQPILQEEILKSLFKMVPQDWLIHCQKILATSKTNQDAPVHQMHSQLWIRIHQFRNGKASGFGPRIQHCFTAYLVKQASQPFVSSKYIQHLMIDSPQHWEQMELQFQEQIC